VTASVRQQGGVVKRLLLLHFSFFILHFSFAGAACDCAVCPERENDFVWENDKFGMRAYGPGEYHRWSGFDVFNKGRGAGSVVEMMHKPGACGNWHETPWKGVLDNYTMGASRGVGGIAMFADGEWKTYPDWETSRVIHTGDDYLEFELVYPAFSAAGKMTCHITLRRGERFFRNDVSFQHMPEGFVVGPGLDLEPKRDHKGVLFEDAQAGIVSLFEDPKGANGSTMTAIFAAPGQKFELMTDHMNCRVIGFRSRTFTYYAGASWSLAGEITTAEAWKKVVDAASCRVRGEGGHLVQTRRDAASTMTPETSRLFEKRVDPVSGVVSYALSGGVRENRQSLYFTVKSMTDDGRFLVFDRSDNERFNPDGSFFSRHKAVVDFAKDAVFDLPGADGKVPFIDPKDDYLVTADDRGFVRYDLREPSKPVRLCGFPQELLKLGKPRYWFTHLTLTTDRKKAFLDTCFEAPGATNYVQGLLELATGRFEKWGETGFYCNHGQLNPVRDDLALCAWEEAWIGAGAKRWQELGYCPRLWLMAPGGKQTMVRPVGSVSTTHEIWDEDGRGFSWCRPGVCHHDLATGRNEVWCPDERAIHDRITRDGRYIVYDRFDREWWRGCRWAVSFYDRETKRTVDVFSVRPALNPRERPSVLHPDPHPQFVCNDRYVISTACNAEGNMELFVTPVDQLKRATAASADRLFADWPANRDPRTVNRIVTEQFLRADALAYKPVGTDIEKHFKAGYGWGNSIFYATASLWATALENARQFGDRDLEAELVERYRRVVAGKPEVMKPVFHVDYNVVGALPLLVARLTGDAKAKEIGLGLADFQWSEPRKETPVLNGNPEYDEAMRLWKAGYTGETRLWIDDMYMINLLQTQAYRLTGDRKYVDRAAKEMCLYLEKLQLENGLFYHAADVPFVWGRGAGWMAAGMPLVLKCLRPDHPQYARILAGYRRMMAALLRYQRADGLWGQLVDDPTTWGETSGSAMFAYGMTEGVANGWLERQAYGASVRKAWEVLCGRLDEHGNVSDVCIGTNKKNDRAYYLARERINGDPHGQAPLLWLAGALARLAISSR